MGFAASLWRPLGYLTIFICVLSLVTFAVTAGYGTSCGSAANFDYSSIDNGNFFLFTFVAAFIIELTFIGIHIADVTDRFPFNFWGLELGFAVMLAILAFFASVFFADGIRRFKRDIPGACAISTAGWEFAVVMGFLLFVLWLVKAYLLFRDFQISGSGCFDRYDLDLPLPGSTSSTATTITAMPTAASQGYAGATSTYSAAQDTSSPSTSIAIPVSATDSAYNRSAAAESGTFRSTSTRAADDSLASAPGHTTETIETRTVRPDGSVLIHTETRTL